jgi:radical SAM superfamily enzyme YgiQ (UPF0313 family)
MRFLKEQYNPDTLWIADDTFGLNRRWLENWCDEVIRCGIRIPFRCFTRVDVIGPDILARLKAAGCQRIHLGVESGSQRVLDAMQKKTRVADIRRASRQIHEAGIKLNYFIMFGYPGETFKDIQETERLIFEAKPDSVGYSIAYPVPGTEFYEHVKDRLASNSDVLWERTSRGFQLLFRARYPLLYYCLLVRSIESRRGYLNARWSSISKLICLINMILTGSMRWTAEHLWLVIWKLHRSKWFFLPKRKEFSYDEP